MVKIGLLSDTHGHIDTRILNFLSQVDEIWHAGDVGNNGVIEKLAGIKPVRAVYGNIDDHNLRSELPLTQIFTIEKVKVFMSHIVGYPGNYSPGIKAELLQVKPNLVIGGHSHILKVMYDNPNKWLYMNPGAAGISGFHQVRTMLRFSINGTNIQDLEIWEYPR